jgi:hypothetical protein
MAPGIAADAPVQGSRSNQGVVPLASPGAVAQYQTRARIRQSLALPVGLKVARLRTESSSTFQLYDHSEP